MAERAMPCFDFKNKGNRLGVVVRAVDLAAARQVGDGGYLCASLLTSLPDKRVRDQLASFDKASWNNPIGLAGLLYLLLNQHDAIPLAENRQGNMVDSNAVR
jgi:hypothetical protein